MGSLTRGWMTAAGVSLLAFSWFVLPMIFEAVFGLFIVANLTLFLRGICDRPRLALTVLIMGFLCVLVVVLKFPQIRFWPYLAIVFANLGVAFVFGNRLVQKKSSILLQFVEITHRGPAPSDRFVAFLKRQCAAWLLAAMLSVVVSIVAMIWEQTRPTINIFLMLLAISQMIWFVVSHKIAQLKYGRPEHWQTTLSMMLQRDLWTKLEV